MIIFPGSKINLGLNIVNRRADGYHNIESVMVRTGWSDILEIVPSKSASTTLTLSGNHVECPPEKNLVMKAYRALEQRLGPLPAADIYLRKIVPDGAGLGGGSADAAATVKGLNEVFSLGLSREEMAEVCARIGADCPFFIYDTPMLVTGTGTTMRPVEVEAIKGMRIVIIKPQRSVSTAQAYAGAKLSGKESGIELIAAGPASEWPMRLTNGFEPSVGAALPEIELLKSYLYGLGAAYASMSGSGSSVYGLFEGDILADDIEPPVADCITFTGIM